MKRSAVLLFIFSTLFLASLPAIGTRAQTATPPVTPAPPITPAADKIPGTLVVTTPYPVSEMSGILDTNGTVDVTDLAFYFFEGKPLGADLIINEDAPWLPITSAVTTVTRDSSLGKLDTTTMEDGIYALRLHVVTKANDNYFYIVSPVRVNNKRASAPPTIAPTETPLPPPTVPPTQPPPIAPTVTPDPTPYVTPTLSSINVRDCDVPDNDSCYVVAYLRYGQYARVIGISANGSGWYQIRLRTGLVGWVAPTVVRLSGNFAGVPAIYPPAPRPPRPSPTPINIITTPLPPSQQTTYSLNGIALIPPTPTCNVPFQVQVNVTNTGSNILTGGYVTITDTALNRGVVTVTSGNYFPNVNPKQNYVIGVTLNVSTYYNEPHRIRAVAGNQSIQADYVLQRGSCG